MTIKTTYVGGLHTQATHIASGATIETDAPKDNQGKGEAFSPTDLLCASLASCMMTIVGIAARTHGFSVDGMTAETTKIMAAEPRRVGEIEIKFLMPVNTTYSEKQRRIIENAAHTCPVAKSLSEELVQRVEFIYA